MPNLNYLPAELVNLVIDHLHGQTAFGCLSPTQESASNGSTPYLNLERTLEMSGQIEEEPPSSGPPESAGLLQDWVTHDSSHPLSDFPFCSALAWCHEIRRGEWDPIFSFFLSYLPNLESLTVQDPDEGARCPFSQCYYLTTFMKRATMSQMRRSHSTNISRLASHLRNNPSKHQLTRDSSRLQPVVSKKRKWSFPDELQLSNNKAL